MLWQALSAARDLGRVQDIAAVLIRYGFGDVVQRIGMAGMLEKAGKVLHWRQAEELATLKTTRARAPGDGRAWADLRQARPGTGHPR